MRAVVLNATWAPRASAEIGPRDAARRRAPDASRVWRDPAAALTTVDDPGAPRAGELLIEVAACGICGSDVHMVETDDDGYMLLPYHVACPVVMGHELAGVVREVGPQVDDVRAGDLVAVESIQHCGACRACLGGFPNSCERREDVGFTVDGGFAELVRVPRKAAWSLHPLLERYESAERALEVGAMCEPVGVAYEGMFTRAGGFKPGATVLVTGAGPIGLASVALAAAAGAAAVVCVEPVPERRALARALGATHALDPRAEDAAPAVEEASRGAGAALAVEASGDFAAAMALIERALAVGGRAVVVGMDARPARVDLVRYQLHAASLYGSLGHCGGWSYPNVINLMASGRIEMERAITRRVELAGAVEALGAMGDRTDGKVLVKPGAAA